MLLLLVGYTRLLTVARRSLLRLFIAILLLISFDFRLPIKLQSFPGTRCKGHLDREKKKQKIWKLKWRSSPSNCGDISEKSTFVDFSFSLFFLKNCEFRHLTSFQDRSLACLACMYTIYIHSRDCIYNIKTERVEKGVKCWLVSAALVAATINPSICVCVCFPGITQP